ncbi:MAG: flagellar basal body rod protein FlgB, partial [Desulfohalobiaceae bacterium]
RHMPVAFSPGAQGSLVVHEPAARLVQGLDSVDLDKEMAAMAKNTMLYNAVSTILHNNFTGMKDIITQGAR